MDAAKKVCDGTVIRTPDLHGVRHFRGIIVSVLQAARFIHGCGPAELVMMSCLKSSARVVSCTITILIGHYNLC